MERVRSLASWLGAKATRSGRDLLYLLATGVTSVLAFCVWVTAVSLTVSLLIFVIGVFVWLVKCVTTDPQTWKDLAWPVVHSVLGFVAAVVALSATVAVLGYVLMPAWWWAIPDPSTQHGTLNPGIFTVESTGQAFIVTAIGLALAPLVWWLDRGAVAGHTALAARLLAPSEKQRLRARVADIATSRADAVEQAQEQLERIERGLHDGAQARRVGLAMELGMAEEELPKDPGAAVETVRRARDETLAAATCRRTASPTRASSSRRCGGSPPAAPRSIPRRSPSCWGRARTGWRC